MSDYYEFTASVPLKAPKTDAQEQAIGALESLLDQCEDISMEELEDPEGGGTWLEVRCPSQSMNYPFIRCLDQAFAKLGPFATKAFALKYRYENEDFGIDFHGPTEASIQEARRQWHQAKAAESLKAAGLDLAALLEAQSFVLQVAGLGLWGEAVPENGGRPFEPCDGVDDSHACLMDLARRARRIADAGTGQPAR